MLLGDCVLNFVQYWAHLHFSVQNVWGFTFFLDTLYIVTCDISKLDKSACNMKSVSAAFTPKQEPIHCQHVTDV